MKSFVCLFIFLCSSMALAQGIPGYENYVQPQVVNQVVAPVAPPVMQPYQTNPAQMLPIQTWTGGVRETHSEIHEIRPINDWQNYPPQYQQPVQYPQVYQQPYYPQQPLYQPTQYYPQQQYYNPPCYQQQCHPCCQPQYYYPQQRCNWWLNW